MGWFGRRNRDVPPEQKWDFISLNDFKSSNCLTITAYGYLWFSLFLSLAFYAVDTLTAVQLLAFNKWSGVIAPSQLISFDVSKWISSICIILSFINLGYEHIRARGIMKRGSVAECYLDSLAVRLESVRLGKGQGWKRFLVFAELTKSKKGAEYVALFTYFSFQAWIRVLICSGPRQVVNALTLYSVYRSSLQINGTNFQTSLMDLFRKIGALASENYQQALILSGMLFTLVVWVVSFISLLLAANFFIFFLWCYIPRADGGLSGYCERKATKRLMKIVSDKINKAMADDERRRRKAEMKAAKQAGADRPVSMQATLPKLADGGFNDELPKMPVLQRNDTMGSLPPYTSMPGTPIEMDSLDQKRPVHSRTGTMASSTSQFSARAPLLDSAAAMGIDRAPSPVPTLPPLDINNYPPARSGSSATTTRPYGPGQPPSRAPTNDSRYGAGFSASPVNYSASSLPTIPPAVRSPSAAPDGYRGFGPAPMAGRSAPRPMMDEFANGLASPAPSSFRGPSSITDEYSNGRASPAPSGFRGPGSIMDGYPNGRASPAPSAGAYRGPLGPPGPPAIGPPGMGANGPMRSATNPMPYRDPGSPAPSVGPYRGPGTPVAVPHSMAGPNGPMRSVTNPMPPRGPASPAPSVNPYGQPAELARNPMPPRGPGQNAPQRNMTDPFHQPTASSSSLRNMTMPPPPTPSEYNYFNRSGTPSSPGSMTRGGYTNSGRPEDVERGSRY